MLNSTGHLSISISSLPTHPLYITSTDPDNGNATSTKRVSIVWCSCNNGGTCRNDTSGVVVNSNGHYRPLCDCPMGYSGDYCDVDSSGCGSNSCPSYTVCVDDDNGYNCTSCANGFNTSTEGKCIGKRSVILIKLITTKELLFL